MELLRRGAKKDAKDAAGKTPLALALDNLAIAMSELGNISERRTYQLVAGTRGLPPFLVANSGLNSGFMIPQYTAASMVSHNKQLCTPSSVDSIESSQGQLAAVSIASSSTPSRASAEIWNNDGDVVSLFDDRGVLIVQVRS